MEALTKQLINQLIRKQRNTMRPRFFSINCTQPEIPLFLFIYVENKKYWTIDVKAKIFRQWREKKNVENSPEINALRHAFYPWGVIGGIDGNKLLG